MRVSDASLFALAALCSLAHAQPLGTGFTYQGELRVDGELTSAVHDLRFRLYDALLNGVQVGSTLCADNVTVTEGTFTVHLDFGQQFAGQQRFVEVEARADAGQDCSDISGFTVLAPRQPLTAAPNALYALTSTTASTATTAGTATNATQLNGQTAAFYQNAANLSTGTIPNNRLGGTYTSALTFSNSGNAYSGNGALLTSLNASNIASGTLDLLGMSTAQTQIIRGINQSSVDNSVAIWGSSPAATGETIGVKGSSGSSSGVGVFGLSTSTTGFGGYGVRGETRGLGGSAVRGDAMATTGSANGGTFITLAPNGVGVSGHNSANGSAGGYGGYFEADGMLSTGVYGEGGNWGGDFEGRAAWGGGVRGRSTNTETGVIGYGGYFEAVNGSGIGVYGVASAPSGGTFGGYFESMSTVGTGLYGEGRYKGGEFVVGNSGLSSAYGVYARAVGSGVRYGVYAISESSTGRGINGVAAAGTGINYGVAGRSHSTTGYGVFGEAIATSGQNFGVYGETESTNGTGVFGIANATTGENYGVRAQAASTAGIGVYSQATASTGTTFAGIFQAASTTGRGVFAWASATSGGTYGLFGQSDSPTGYGVFASGASGGTIKTFRIDHPDAPAEKYLLHYSTESPEVLNAYSGTAVLDSAGEAEVELPRYFAKINKDPRYTLTAVGAPMPMLHVAQKISDESLAIGASLEPDQAAPLCTFRIAGGAPGMEVSWRIEAVRNDRWVQRHGAPVEIEKQGVEQGTYQHPDLYNKPRGSGLGMTGAASR